MNRIGTVRTMLWSLALAALLTVGTVAAEEDGWHGKMSWTVVDADGNERSKTYEFDGPRPFLGVGLTHGSGGARIESVVEDSPAEAAGLQAGDVIVGYDGREIETPWDLTHAVLESEPGSRVELEIERDGRRETVRAEIGEHEGWGFDHEALGERMRELGDRLGNGAHAWAFRGGRPQLGVELVDATSELREHLGARADEGVLVGRVLEDTPAERAGVAVGDLIVAIDGESVGHVGDLRRLLAERGGETFGVEVIRDGRPVSLTVILPEREEDDALPGRLRRFERHGTAPSEQT